MAKAVSTQPKAGVSEADLLGAVKNDPEASRNQVPPGQTAKPEPQAELKPPEETKAVANNPEASRNQIPPGQAPATGVQTSSTGNFSEQPKLEEFGKPEPSAASVTRAPTDAEISDFLARRFPGITMADIQAAQDKKGSSFLADSPALDENQALLLRYGPNYITATLNKGSQPEKRYFTAVAWRNMSQKDKEMFSQVVIVPPEVQALQKKQNG